MLYRKCVGEVELRCEIEANLTKYTVALAGHLRNQRGSRATNATEVQDGAPAESAPSQDLLPSPGADYSTTTLPFMLGWMLQWKLNSPGTVDL